MMHVLFIYLLFAYWVYALNKAKKITPLEDILKISKKNFIFAFIFMLIGSLIKYSIFIMNNAIASGIILILRVVVDFFLVISVLLYLFNGGCFIFFLPILSLKGKDNSQINSYLNDQVDKFKILKKQLNRLKIITLSLILIPFIFIIFTIIWSYKI